MTGKANIRDAKKRKAKQISNNSNINFNQGRGTSYKNGVSNVVSQPLIHTEGDLNLNTYDIYNVDRMLFATTSGAGDTITATDYGIEAIANGATAPYGITYQIPASKIHSFKVGTDVPLTIADNYVLIGEDLTTTNIDVAGHTIKFTETTTPSSSPGTNKGVIYAKDVSGVTTPMWYDGTTETSLLGGGSSGANLTLNNLTDPTSVNRSLIPSANNSKSLGSASLQWENLFIDGIARIDSLGFGDSYSMTLPTTLGTNGQVLTTNGSSALSWTTVSGAGLGDNNTFTGTNYFDTTATGSTTSAPIKFQGDGNNTAQRVLEIGKYGAHGAKFIGEILGDTGRSMTNPDGGSDIPVPGTNEPALSIKGAMIMNTYTMYDLDTLVFSQGVSSTTPPPENDWVYIEANTGTSGSANLTGMTYNVPTSKTHQFKVNGSLKISIDDDIEFEANSTLEIANVIATPSSLSTGGATALPSAPTAYFKVHYNGADRYIPYYT